MAKKIDDFEVDNIDMELRRLEGELEKLGQKICDVEGSFMTWHDITDAISRVQSAICESWRMRL